MHPCLRCGACCHHHRVAFEWHEAEDITPGGVPLRLCIDHNKDLRCMQGTREGGRCAALVGSIGEATSCTIHSRRPSPCRAFAASFEHGQREPRCEASRQRHGLRPLTPADWEDAASDE